MFRLVCLHYNMQTLQPYNRILRIVRLKIRHLGHLPFTMFRIVRLKIGHSGSFLTIGFLGQSTLQYDIFIYIIICLYYYIHLRLKLSFGDGSQLFMKLSQCLTRHLKADMLLISSCPFFSQKLKLYHVVNTSFTL